MCGALLGSVLAIGLLHGQDQVEAAVPKVHTRTAEFMRRFAGANGAVRCIDIIGFDISSAMAGDDISSIKGLLWFFIRGGLRVCNGTVSSAVQVLLELLEDQGD